LSILSIYEALLEHKVFKAVFAPNINNQNQNAMQDIYFSSLI